MRIKNCSHWVFKFSKSIIKPIKSFIYICIFPNKIIIWWWKKVLFFNFIFKKIIFQYVYLLKTDNFWKLTENSFCWLFAKIENVAVIVIISQPCPQPHSKITFTHGPNIFSPSYKTYGHVKRRRITCHLKAILQLLYINNAILRPM